MIKHQDNKTEETTLTLEEESKIWQAVAGADMVKRLGPITREEYEYYNNL